jgi:predicted negative regulator of RcsB-dependent stress response
MSAYDLEEQERISALKDWWDKWGTLVYLALAAFFIGVIAVQGYTWYQRDQAAKAEELFKSVKKTAEEAAASKEPKKLSDAANAMSDKFPRSFHASESQLMAAKASFEAKDLAAAKTHLQWVIDRGREAHQPIARIRMASVMLEDKKYDDALKTLDGVREDAFASMAADLRGDIFAAQGKRDEARAAYQLAVEKSGDRSSLKSISQAKLDAMGGAVANAAADAKAADNKTDTKPADDKGTK